MRRPSTTRLAVAAAAVALVAGGAVAGAAVLDDGPRRPPETSLMGAVQGFLEAERPAGLTADLSLTTRLVETGGLADGSGILGGATGHIAIDGDGRARLDVETARGETRIGYDGGRLTVYDLPTNTVYGLDAPEWLRAQGVVADDEQPPGGDEADALGTVLGLAGHVVRLRAGQLHLREQRAQPEHGAQRVGLVPARGLLVVRDHTLRP